MDNHTLSLDIFHPEVTQITTTCIFLVKASHMAMPIFKRVENYISTMHLEESMLKGCICFLITTALP